MRGILITQSLTQFSTPSESSLTCFLWTFLRSKALILCLLAMALSSCSLPVTTSIHEPQVEGDRGAKLLNIRFERWGTTVFTGLLGLRKGEKSLYYILLDATGVKLIEAEVGAVEGHRLVRAMGTIKDSRLPAALSQALARIYIYEPQEKPCSNTLILRFCREEDSASEKKYVETGPFRHWQVDIFNANGVQSIEYHQPWTGVAMVLQNVNGPRQ